MFQHMQAAAPDAILGLSKSFAADPRADKLDLGVGVYRTPDGATPIMQAVARAEAALVDREMTKAYTPVDGAPGFVPAIMRLVLGEQSEALASGRAVAIQSVGGCGALRLAGELIASAGARAVSVGAPTWANHRPIMSAAGNEVRLIDYYDKKACAVDFDAFRTGVAQLGPQDVLLLHGACHNPTGADLTPTQIDEIAEMARDQGFLPLVDVAYHGFAQDLESDAYIIRRFAERAPELLITYSCSKNFGLYRERIGALIMVCENADRASAVKSQAALIARRSYSMPPAHGGAIVAEILASTELSDMWRTELAAMSRQVRANRALLTAAGRSAGLDDRLDYIEGQSGMFSMLPLSDEAVVAMREELGVYIVGGGRINLCGVNSEAAAAQLAQGFKQLGGR